MESPSSRRQAIALVAPRPGTISPWSSKASDIAHNCGLNQVLRLERGTLWRLSTAEAQPTEQYCVNDQSFSLHAEVRCAINQRHKLEHLCRYITRPVLSTISVDVPGYPFGSVVPYCLDRQGRRVIHISRIAQHCKSHHGRPPIPAERSPDQQVQALESKKPGVRHSSE